MQFPLRTLVLLPAFVAATFGCFLILDRDRVIGWETASEFWYRFGADCLLILVATICVVGCFATLRPRDRPAFSEGPRRACLAMAAFLLPFIAGLNVVIGVAGGSDPGYSIRVYHVYQESIAYGFDPVHAVTITGHLVITAVFGLATLWICGRLTPQPRDDLDAIE